MPVFLVPIEKGRTIVLGKPILFFGRHPDCDVVLSRSRKVSRKHCCVAQIDDGLIVRDFSSLNGVRINGERIEGEARLEIGDELAIGDVRYRVQSGDPGHRPNTDPAPNADVQLKAPPVPIDDPEASSISPQAIDPAQLSQEFPVAIPDELDSDEEEPEA